MTNFLTVRKYAPVAPAAFVDQDVLFYNQRKFSALAPARWNLQDSYSLGERKYVPLPDGVPFTINLPPVLDNPISDQITFTDELYLFVVPADTFSDPEAQPLTYEATLDNDDPLPAWLVFTPATRTFEGTPLLEDAGTLLIKVSASDGVSAATDTFELLITPFATYPAELGEPVRDGFSIKPRKQSSSIATESTLTRRRNVSFGDVYVLACRFKFKSATDRQIFENFLTVTIDYGAHWFRADWFSGWGFAPSTWVFKFIKLDEVNSAYASDYSAPMLMMPLVDAPLPGPLWPTSEVDPGFLDQRFGLISPVSAVASGASTTVFDVAVGEGDRARWRVGWVIDFYDLELGTIVADGEDHTILTIVGDTITLAAAALFTPDNTMGIRFSEYDNVDTSQKTYGFITDDDNDFPSDGGSAYLILYS